MTHLTQNKQQLQFLIALEAQQQAAADVDKALETLLNNKRKELVVVLASITDKTSRQSLRTLQENASYTEAVNKINKIFQLSEDEKNKLEADQTYIEYLIKKHQKALRQELAKKQYLSEKEINELITEQNKQYEQELFECFSRGRTQLDSKQSLQQAQIDEEHSKRVKRVVWGRFSHWILDPLSALHQAAGFALSCGCTMAGALLMILAEYNVSQGIMIAAIPASLLIVWVVTRANWWICNQVVPRKFVELFCKKENALKTWQQLLEEAFDDLIHFRWLTYKAAEKAFIFLNSAVTGFVWAVFTYVTTDKFITGSGEYFADIFNIAVWSGLPLLSITFATIMAVYTFPTFFCVCLTGLKKNVDNFFGPYIKFWEALKLQAQIKNQSIVKVGVILFLITGLTLLGLFATALASTPAMISIYEFLGSGAKAAETGAYITTALFGFLGASAFYEHMARDATQNIVNHLGEKGGDFEKLETLKNTDPLSVHSRPDYSDVIKEHQKQYKHEQSWLAWAWEGWCDHVWKHINFFTTKPSWHDGYVIGANGGFNGLPAALGGSSMPGSSHSLLDSILSAFYGLSAAFSSWSVNSGGNQPVKTFALETELEELKCRELVQVYPEKLGEGIDAYISDRTQRTSWTFWGANTKDIKLSAAGKLKVLAEADEANVASSVSSFTPNELKALQDGSLAYHTRLVAHKHPHSILT